MNSQPSSFSSRSMNAAGGGAPATTKRGRVVIVVLRRVGIVEDRAQHGGRHAGERHALVLDEPVDVRADDGAQARHASRPSP